MHDITHPMLPDLLLAMIPSTRRPTARVVVAHGVLWNVECMASVCGVCESGHSGSLVCDDTKAIVCF